MRYWLIGVGFLAVAGALGAVWFFQAETAPMPRVGHSSKGRLVKSDQEWQAVLTAEQFRVTRRKGTERAFSGIYAKTKTEGAYHCVCCGQPLFDSKTKYESGTGWPSFWQPIDENNISLIADNALYKHRSEVVCSRCDAHLGHVFSDGPPPTGLRYCLNSASLRLVERTEP